LTQKEVGILKKELKRIMIKYEEISKELDSKEIEIL
jgi:hypothetical protein